MKIRSNCVCFRQNVSACALYGYRRQRAEAHLFRRFGFVIFRLRHARRRTTRHYCSYRFFTGILSYCYRIISRNCPVDEYKNAYLRVTTTAAIITGDETLEQGSPIFFLRLVKFEIRFGVAGQNCSEKAEVIKLKINKTCYHFYLKIVLSRYSTIITQ